MLLQSFLLFLPFFTDFGGTTTTPHYDGNVTEWHWAANGERTLPSIDSTASWQATKSWPATQSPLFLVEPYRIALCVSLHLLKYTSEATLTWFMNSDKLRSGMDECIISLYGETFSIDWQGKQISQKRFVFVNWRFLFLSFGRVLCSGPRHTATADKFVK